MRIADGWKDYTLLDASCGERLEQWGEIFLIRPDPQVVFRTPKAHPGWEKAHARYLRSSAGGGRWEIYRTVPESWKIGYQGLTFALKPMGFKHTGLFPEQAVNWDWMRTQITRTGRPLKILNLFAYTGGATAACLHAGASVTHVDASKGMVAWAKDNAALSGVADKPVRWLVDDCMKFVRRELRRGSRYDGIVMDPPSYGRGPGGEVWKLEDGIYEFLELVCQLLSDDAEWLMVNSYTAGLSPCVMEYMLGVLVQKRRGGCVRSDEIGLPVASTGLALPCGSTAVWSRSALLL